MTLLFCDGFDDGMTSSKYSGFGGGTVSATYGRNGNGIGMQNGVINRKIIPAADEHATLIQGVAWKPMSQSGISSAILDFASDGGATVHLTLYRGTDGTLRVYRGDGTTQLGASVQTFLADTWYYVEMKATLSDTVGTAEVRVNGVVWIALTNVDTKNGGTKTVFDSYSLRGVGGNAGGRIYAFDDYYVCNGAGAVNNDFLGEIAIETLLPNGNGSQSDFSGTDGNSVDNYLLVDETTPNITDYVGSSVSGARDLYTFADLTRTGGTVKGVQVSGYVGKSDSLAVSYKLPVARSGTVNSGPTKAIAGAAGAFEAGLRIAETDPVSGAAFTIANVNSIEAGVEVA